MTIKYVLRRVGVLCVVVTVAATINFMLPRLIPANPIAGVLGELSAMGATIEGVDEIIAVYEERVGLDKPLWRQYVNYLGGIVLRQELGYSIAYFPSRVEDMIFSGLRWTVGLLAVATLIAFAGGTLLGALLSWTRSPGFLWVLMPMLMPLAAIPYYLLGLILIFLFAFTYDIFPLIGAHEPGMKPGLSLEFLGSVLYHGTLPALSIVLATLGFWAIGMRGLMVTVLGEDYLTLAEAKGLRNRRIFLRYGVRNAILPQVTALTLSLGTVVSGSVLVEVIFGYPGIGFLLFNAIRTADYFLIQGIVFILIISVAVAMFVVDMIYPLLDPRISYEGR